MPNHVIRSGETLTSIAKRFGTTVDALAKANNIKNPDKIYAGKSLRIPDEFTPAKTNTPRKSEPTTGGTTNTPRKSEPTTGGTTNTPRNTAPKTGGTTTQAPAPRRGDVFTPPTNTTQAPRQGKTSFTDGNRTFPQNDGVPVFNQADAQWGAQKLGGKGEFANSGVSKSDIQSKGCAISSCAMAVSALSGQTITPEEMDNFLDNNRGYDGNNVFFEKVGGAVKSDPPIRADRRGDVGPKTIDGELAKGRPVVLGVDHTGDGKTDHWITVTGKNADGTYRANDPAGGKQITLRAEGGKLVGAAGSKTYRSNGNGVTFTGGRPVGSQTQAGGNGGTTGTQQPRTGGNTSTTQQPRTGGNTSTTQQPRTPTTTGGSGAATVGNLKLKPYSGEVKQAVENASKKVGVDYGYMMAMAAQESSFNPEIKAKTSSATGLYQFINQTWLGTVKEHGAKHGLGDLASKIQQDRKTGKFFVTDKAAEAQIFQLRKDPNTAALMGAEFAKSNQKYLENKLGHKVGPTDMYMAHFLGPSAAGKFLAARDAGKGGQSAADMFPAAAKANRNIFYDKAGNERSLDQVYALLNNKIAPYAEAYASRR